MSDLTITVQYSLLMCIVWGAWFQWNLLADQGGCRLLTFAPPVDGKRLEGHVFLNLSIGIYIPCEHRCVRESRCVSVNIGPSMENNKITCELNDADHLQFPDDLKDHTGWTYSGSENPCFRNPCFQNRTCVINIGYSDKRFTCLCPSGYTGEQCERDIDECTTGTHKCSADAVCNNTKGSYNCTCKPGFDGDGQNCQDIDECTTGTHKCSADAVCNNTKGSYNCTCKTGFDWDGQNCQDIDECLTETHECKAYEMCNNTKGSHNCTRLPCETLHKRNLSEAIVLGHQQILLECFVINDTGLGECGNGTWTLVMKINGINQTFRYDSPLWNNSEPYNLEGGKTGFDTQETKLPTYWNNSFSKICLGMKIDQQLNFIVINMQASSLYSLIADGQYRKTSRGRDGWKKLLGSKGSLQRKCNKEGFNLKANLGNNRDSQKARIGIFGNNEDDCASPDSRIGFGITGYRDTSITCGNVEYRDDNSDNANAVETVGYILVQ